MKVFSFDDLDRLIKGAEKSERLRTHFNVHESYQDATQKIFIALKSDSYIRPHRHTLDPKEECLIAIRGLMSLVLFSDWGEVRSITLFGSEKYTEKMSVASGVQVSANDWHTVISLSEDSILFEVKDGPYDVNFSKEFSNWSPAEDCNSSINYLKKIKELCIECIPNHKQI